LRGASFPIAPTDLVGYVCGALHVDLKKYVLGVAIGEGAIRAIYIFIGATGGQVLLSLLTSYFSLLTSYFLFLTSYFLLLTFYFLPV
jgi:uncharacterized membrane protein YdjX (TVP38/TMEM64 family)